MWVKRRDSAHFDLVSRKSEQKQLPKPIKTKGFYTESQ